MEGGAPGLSTVYLIQMPNDMFHPVGSGISHLSRRNERELRVDVYRQNRVQYVMSTYVVRVVIRSDALEKSRNAIQSGAQPRCLSQVMS
ncbi:hypothetical protein IG631_08178 [Alternaria alternata]|nr:hypothetical protein IG631_08178 [Alternaria alternata]